MSIEREYQPDFDAEEASRASQPRYQLAREHARALHKKYNVTGPPVDIEMLIRERELRLVKVDVNAKLSGVLYAKVPEIVVNRRDRTVARQRFTMAHELGHWEMKHYASGELPEDTLGYSGA